MNQYTEPRPFTGHPFDEEHDPQHPGIDGSARLVVERHIHRMVLDATEDIAYVPVTATYFEGVGEQIELGPWSLSIDEARILAGSLVALSNLIDTKHPDTLIHDVTEETTR